MSKQERDQYIEKICTDDNSSKCADEKDLIKNYPIHSAAGWGIMDELKDLVQNNTNQVNNPAYGEGGWTPLHFASRYGRTDAAKFLLESGADVNAKTSYGWTPIHWAQNADIVQLFCINGANVNDDMGHGRTPLVDKMVNGNGRIGLYEVVKALISPPCNAEVILSFPICSDQTEIGQKLQEEGLCIEISGQMELVVDSLD